MTRLGTRLRLSLSTWPDRRGWIFTLAVTAAWFVAALVIGSASGFFRFGGSDATVRSLAVFAVIALAVPCLAEEVVFRALPLPHRSETASIPKRLAISTLALAAFVAWHPLNGWLLKVSAWSVFTDPAFLSLAALLGLACTAAYQRTGSVWPAVAIHWLTLMVWKVCLGGKLIGIAS